MKIQVSALVLTLLVSALSLPFTCPTLMATASSLTSIIQAGFSLMALPIAAHLSLSARPPPHPLQGGHLVMSLRHSHLH
jgi:hypothetical protein